jgi:ATP phosphoribosyltransferase regulatory subunit
MRLRGEPARVLYQLEQWLGPVPLLAELGATLAAVAPAAERLGVQLQLDPSFQPHFALYDGLVLKLVCQGAEAPVEIASGGRYDALVGRFCQEPSQAAGVGFGFDIEAVRELVSPELDMPAPVLVAYGRPEQLATALDHLEALHQAGTTAELLSGATASQANAEAIGEERGCSRTLWIAP